MIIKMWFIHIKIKPSYFVYGGFFYKGIYNV